jgi:WD40 repeat protein
VLFATIAPTSHLMVTGGHGESSLRLWDLYTGSLVAQFNNNLERHPLWSRDGRTLVIRDPTSLRFLSMIVFRELAAFPVGDHNLAFPVGFSPGERALVAGTWEHQVKAWSPPTLSEIDLQP